jgi:hypothetical protein
MATERLWRGSLRGFDTVVSGMVWRELRMRVWTRILVLAVQDVNRTGALTDRGPP